VRGDIEKQPWRNSDGGVGGKQIRGGWGGGLSSWGAATLGRAHDQKTTYSNPPPTVKGRMVEGSELQ
jgi:hypothetical protein